MTDRIHRLNLEKYGPLVALAILFTVSALTSEHFLKPQNLLNILRQVSYTGIIGLGMTFVIIAGGIDLSVGSLTALAGGLAILSLNQFGGGWGAIAMAMLVSLVAGAAGGAVNGLLVTKGRVAPFIATLGTMAVFRSTTLYIQSAGEYQSSSELYASIGMGNWLGIPIPVWVFLTLTVVFAIVLNRTPFGRYVCAVGANERVARYSAINVHAVRFMTYLIVGLTVGITALLLSSRMNSISSSNAGANYELDAIAVAIIGGTSLSGGSGSMFGTLIGAVILGIVNNMLNMWEVSPYLQGAVKGAVIIGAVLIQRKRS